MPEFVRDNAGKAFEFMVDKVDEDRKTAGMSTIAEAFAGETGEMTTKRQTRYCAQEFCQPCWCVEPCLAMRALPSLAPLPRTSCMSISVSLATTCHVKSNVTAKKRNKKTKKK